MPRKRGVFFLCAAICPAVLIAAGLLLLVHSGEIGEQLRLFRAEDIAEKLHSGDIVCRMGTGFWSCRIRDFSPAGKRYSHAGILIREGGRFFVIHAEGNDFSGAGTVRMDTLQTFLDSAKAYGIYRLKERDGGCLAESAKQYLGYPFDWRFDTNNHERIYCTELLQLCLEENYPDMKLDEKDGVAGPVIPVDACCSEEFFEEVVSSPESLLL